uniref:Katanin p80 WD40-containing subunit B1 n=1 Tax=Zeugodacus cucurbitae TaxID=28588 RepID=A0A0A1X3Q0_ZEUCU
MTATEINPPESYNSNVEEYEIPGAEELENLYMLLEKGTIPELQWQFPGRQQTNNETVAPKVEPAASANTEEEPAAKTDFDFSDDVTQPQMRVRNQNSTPKSTKKKVANFAGVMEVLKKKNAEGSS